MYIPNYALITDANNFAVQDEFKKVNIPLKNIDAISLDGYYLLKYRIVSDDGTQKSHWSSMYKIYLPFSASELLGFAKITTSTYTSSNQLSITSSPAIPSSITDNGATSNKIYTYTWKLFDHKNNIIKNFDVYFRWKNATTGWGDWVFSGTTSGNSFSVSKFADSTFVQGAVCASTYTKSTLIHKYTNVLLSVSAALAT
jgi:hypothetical protein